ncbi:hypothetical protein Ssi03_31140 [Sphaerisporangium siamense]|uniref:Uncharacterized protein n=1 Tax=Sphaerisporangium siamense TaxID=795645 RepID=A0A7W7DCW0_9ACTN|nr:hypothetical protein [Sphaerisporangium siamense]MBB4704194.1 hypothetical protein [Sphaerisporangium siamense]GII85124.1 hypothetical protein Ssi03_31140 [Sphaerisporangium siamense]
MRETDAGHTADDRRTDREATDDGKDDVTDMETHASGAATTPPGDALGAPDPDAPDAGQEGRGSGRSFLLGLAWWP